MVNVQLNTGLSNLGMRKLVRAVNQASDSKLVEPNFDKKFQAAGRQLKDFFTNSRIKVTNSKGETNADHIVAHCKDITELLNTVSISRNVSTERIVKLGIDGGKGFLKFCLGVIDINTTDSQPHKHLLTQRLAKDTSVKRQMLVAVSEALPENYENVRQIWSLIHAEEIKAFVICDLKLANILCGLQAHSSSHPCTWCNVDNKSLEMAGTLRTLGSLRESFESFMNSGSIYAKAKETGNVVHLPIISGSNETLILDIVPPPELHLLLGVVNQLFRMLQAVWPDANTWPSSLKMDLSPYHGGMFEGNECRKLLRNVDKLQQLAEAKSAFQVFGIVEALRKFDAVVKSCFGSELHNNFSEKIQEFRDSYLAIPNASVTPKIHAVFHHIKDFVDRQMSPLGIYSEQAVEAAHQDFSPQWQRFKRIPSNPDYAENLTSCLVDYNSKHL